MFVPPLRLALRRLARQPGTSLLHISGLALGLACCALVALYVRAELSFDRFHEDAEQIVTVGQELDLGGEPVKVMSLPGPVTDALETDLPEVEAVAQIGPFEATVTPEGASEGFREPEAMTAGPSFFDVFTFPLVEGDAATALAEPNTVVLTEATARRYFGTTDVVGRTLTLRPRSLAGFQTTLSGEAVPFRVTGVAVNPPTTSTIRFALLISEPTKGDAHEHFAFGGRPYVRLQDGVTPDAFRASLHRVAIAAAEGDEPNSTWVSRLVDAHFEFKAEGLSGDRLYLYLFSAVALFILLLAVINYVNLATAQAAERAAEVGVRKAIGALRGEVARQFLVESVLTALAAGVLALGLAALAVPGFNALFGTAVTLGLGADAWLVAALLGAAVVVGLVAGAYPALYLSRFQPVPILRGHPTGPSGRSRFRQGLVVTQFAVTAVLLVGTAVVYSQLRHLESRPRGIETSRLVAVTLGDPDAVALNPVLKRAALALPGVEAAAAASGVPGDLNSGVSIQVADGEEPLPVRLLSIDADGLGVLGVEVVRDDGLREAMQTVGSEPVRVLNEAAVRQVGGMPASGRLELESGPVAAVVRDFPFASGREEIGPLLILVEEGERQYARLLVKLRPGQVPETLAALRAEWQDIAPGRPFEAAFVDDTYDELYAVERRLGRVFAVFAGLAVLVACLGLFGLAAYTTARRTKEIGIRKVLGASVATIVRTLLGDFARLVLVAVVVAVPVGYLLAERWLEAFAYRIDLGPAPFVLAGALVLAVALLTVSVHAVRAATADPVRALRSE